MTRTKSEKLFPEALKHIPGGVNSPVRALRPTRIKGLRWIRVGFASRAFKDCLLSDRPITFLAFDGHGITTCEFEEVLDFGASPGRDRAHPGCRVWARLLIRPSMGMTRSMFGRGNGSSTIRRTFLVSR